MKQGHAQWPTQVITGHVHALEKLPGAWKASQGNLGISQQIRARPSHRQHTREGTHRLVVEHAAPAGRSPRRPNPDGRVVADVVKARNLLPRMPLLAIGLYLGIPHPIIRAWTSALTQLSRAFCVRGTIGPPLTSSTGFAEGCGLSCSAMLLCNITLAKCLGIRYPSVRLWSYVDNLAELWSNRADDRALARQQATPLQSSTRDLGAHMEYGRKNTNHVLRNRLASMPRVWIALAKSPAPYRQKVHALRTKGWPQALAAGSPAPLGDAHIRTLRAGACRRIRAHAQGIGPMAHLSLIEHPLTDPGCHLLVHAVQNVRRYANHDQVHNIIERILLHWHELPTRRGPCHVLLDRLRSIGWKWLGHGRLVDHEGSPVDMFHGSLTELRDRLTQGWQNFVKQSVSRRKTFQGMNVHHGKSPHLVDA